MDLNTNPMFVFNFAKGCIFSYWSKLDNKKGFHHVVLGIYVLKAKIMGVFEPP